MLEGKKKQSEEGGTAPVSSRLKSHHEAWRDNNCWRLTLRVALSLPRLGRLTLGILYLVHWKSQPPVKPWQTLELQLVTGLEM